MCSRAQTYLYIFVVEVAGHENTEDVGLAVWMLFYTGTPQSSAAGIYICMGLHTHMHYIQASIFLCKQNTTSSTHSSNIIQISKFEKDLVA